MNFINFNPEIVLPSRGAGAHREAVIPDSPGPLPRVLRFRYVLSEYEVKSKPVSESQAGSRETHQMVEIARKGLLPVVFVAWWLDGVSEPPIQKKRLPHTETSTCLNQPCFLSGWAEL